MKNDENLFKKMILQHQLTKLSFINTDSYVSDNGERVSLVGDSTKEDENRKPLPPTV